MKIIKNYRKDHELRQSFNQLTEKTFGFHFEDWYQKGFWNENYIPYSILENGKIISNVSVNLTDIKEENQVNHYIQLGTVMTDEAYRNQGFIRILMQEIQKDFQNSCDGVYLFANDEVLNFYPKFGFEKAKEYSYFKEVKNHTPKTVQSFDITSKENQLRLKQAFEKNVFAKNFDMVNNFDLIMFYLTSYMQNNIYYEPENQAYIIADIQNNELFIHNIFSETNSSLEKIIQAFGSEITKVRLGFTPAETSNWQCEELHEDDCTLFIRDFSFNNKKVMFPTLSHA